MTVLSIKFVNSYTYQDGPPKSVAAHELPQYATYIPDRRPAFKPHNTIGQAKNAINIKEHRRWRDPAGFSHDMGIYRLFGNEYELILKITKGSKREDYPTLNPPAPTVHQLQRAEELQRQEDQERLRSLRAQADALEAKIKKPT